MDILEIISSREDRFNFMKGLIILAKAQEISEGLNSINEDEAAFFRKTTFSNGDFFKILPRMSWVW